ncbi:hypothetical protein BGZ65_012298, partial [Modicella reniformis]
MTQSGGESIHNSSESESESEDESDAKGGYHNSGDKINQQGDYFGNATAEDALQGGNNNHRRRSKKEPVVESPGSEDGLSPARKRVQRRGSAAELRRIRQLLQRAENTTQSTLKARLQHHERMQKEALHQTFQFDHDRTTPPS